MKTSQLICSANQLTGFYMMVTLAFNESIHTQFPFSVPETPPPPPLKKKTKKKKTAAKIKARNFQQDKRNFIFNQKGFLSVHMPLAILL